MATATVQERVILVEESTVHAIKRALSCLQEQDKAKQRRIQEELNRRAINMLCQGMIADPELQYEQDPLHYRFVAMVGRQCMVHDVQGHNWLLLGI